MPACVTDNYTPAHTPTRPAPGGEQQRIPGQTDVRESRLLLVREAEAGSREVQGISVSPDQEGFIACPEAGVPTPVFPLAEFKEDSAPSLVGPVAFFPRWLPVSHEPLLKTAPVQPNPGEPGSGEQEVREHVWKQTGKALPSGWVSFSKALPCQGLTLQKRSQQRQRSWVGLAWDPREPQTTEGQIHSSSRNSSSHCPQNFPKFRDSSAQYSQFGFGFREGHSSAGAAALYLEWSQTENRTKGAKLEKCVDKGISVSDSRSTCQLLAEKVKLI